MNGPAMTVRTSPAIPLPPMPSTRTLSIDSRSGSPPISAPAAAASSTCSGRPAAASNIPSVSSTSCVPASAAISPTSLLGVRLERGLDALGSGLGDEPLVLGVVHGLGLVDQHDGDAVVDGVPAL